MSSALKLLFIAGLLSTCFARDIVTNKGVIVLSEAGFSDAFIIKKITLSQTQFDTSPEGLAELRKHGISEELVEFVLEHAVRPKAAIQPPVLPVAAQPVYLRQWYFFGWRKTPVYQVLTTSPAVWSIIR